MKHNLGKALAWFMLVMSGLVLFTSCPAPKPPVEAKAAIIDQLYVLEPNSSLIERTSASLENQGFKVDYYQGDQITVDFYRQLPALGYRLIIFRAHSGLLGSRGKAIPRTCIFTNEPYSETVHVAEQLSDQLAKARIDANHPWVFGIGADFVKRNMQGRFDHTVIIMMGCSTLYIDYLAQAFIVKGASFFIGWDGTVGLAYTDDITPALLEKILSNEISLQAAVAQVINENGPDPNFSASLKYYPPAIGQKTLNELIR